MANLNTLVIMKASRIPANDEVRETDAYAGATCKDAGVQSGKTYTSRTEAKHDARLLSQHNPVGFCVWRVGFRVKDPQAISDWYENGRPVNQTKT